MEKIESEEYQSSSLEISSEKEVTKLDENTESESESEAKRGGEVELKSADLSFSEFDKNEDESILQLPKKFLQKQWENITKVVDFNKMDEEENGEDDQLELLTEEKLIQLKEKMNALNVISDEKELDRLMNFQFASIDHEAKKIYFNSPNQKPIYIFDIEKNEGKLVRINPSKLHKLT